MKNYTLSEILEIMSLTTHYLDKNNSSAMFLFNEIQNTPDINFNIIVYKSLRVLSHSVGICSPVYEKVWKIARYDGEIRLVNVVQ